MLEPTTQRLTATIAEWHGTHGKALGDDGKTYDLHREQRDVHLLMEHEIGDRIEMYLDLDERGELTKLTFNLSKDGLGGLSQLAGQRFNWQPEKITPPSRWRFLCQDVRFWLGVLIFIWHFAWLGVVLMAFLFIAYIFEKNRQMEERSELAFILNNKGTMVAADTVCDKKVGAWLEKDERRDLGAIFVFWDNIQGAKWRNNQANQTTYLRFYLNEKYIHRANILYDYPTDFKGKDVWVDVRTDLLSDDDKIVVENTICAELARRSIIFQAA
ncbi:MAG: hypothetical protein Q4B82_05960 [Alysiella sp.]|uniref:hypothetical protein n=1 Tax=Alysiella sp. TaxID=1872483 RepID=UPI0026DC208E|nr:hypothetical protein [Alysiella sp.]MDO4434107.1 hypothetical protein [Alysiella sp.]